MKINFAKAEAVQGTVAEVEVAEVVETNVEVDESMTEVAEAVETVEEEVMALSWPELKEVAKELGIKIKGSKEQLQAAVIDALGGETEDAPVTAEAAPITEKGAEEVTHVLKDMQLRSNASALEKYEKRTGVTQVVMPKHVRYKNPVLDEVPNHNQELMNAYLAVRGEYGVMVTWFDIYKRPDEFGRIGEVGVQIPPGYMEIRGWNDLTKKVEWHDFTRYDYDQFKAAPKPWRLRKGSGTLRLVLREGKDGLLFVTLPKSMYNGEYPYVVRTKAIGGNGKAYTDNNVNLEATLTAFMRVVVKEFIQQDPINRFSFGESCDSCRYKIVAHVKDGVTDDLNDRSSSTILQQLDILDLAQYGHRQPQLYCEVREEFVDRAIVEEVNKANQYEKEHYYDEDGVLRWLGPNEVLVSGRPVDSYKLREIGTASICASCPHYHKIDRKTEQQITKELVEKHEKGEENPYVNPYYTTFAKANRMPVQTLVAGKWLLGAPGEFEAPDAFRIKGLGGVVVYGSDAIMAGSSPDYVIPTEEVRWDEFDINQTINRIFYAAFNLEKLTEEQADAIFDLAFNKPDDLDERYSARWDKAVVWLTQSIEWAQEGERTKDAPPFTPVFFHQVTDFQEGMEAIRADDLLTNLHYRMVTGMLPVAYGGQVLDPRQLPAKEFARHLDEEDAMDIVYDALLGQRFFIRGEDRREVELVSESLQELLQSQINSLVYGIRRADDQQQAFDKLKTSDDIKAYIKGRL